MQKKYYSVQIKIELNIFTLAIYNQADWMTDFGDIPIQ
jgi:hypothetical protein